LHFLGLGKPFILVVKNDRRVEVLPIEGWGGSRSFPFSSIGRNLRSTVRRMSRTLTKRRVSQVLVRIYFNMERWKRGREKHLLEVCG
jgi:hypothetical protein